MAAGAKAIPGHIISQCVSLLEAPVVKVEHPDLGSDEEIEDYDGMLDLQSSEEDSDEDEDEDEEMLGLVTATDQLRRGEMMMS
eukprot:g21525.t1